MKTRALLLLVVCACACAGSGCVSVRLDNSQRLIKRPDFQDARRAAPEWCREALKTINRLEAEIERR